MLPSRVMPLREAMEKGPMSWPEPDPKDLEKTPSELAKELAVMRLHLEMATDGWWVWPVNDPNDYEYMSPRLKATLGYTDEEMPNVSASWKKLIHPDDHKLAEAAAVRHIETGAPYSLPVRYKHANGRWVWVICRGQMVMDAEGNPDVFLGAHQEITHLKRMEEQLRSMTRIDGLTGLLNRRALAQHLTMAIARAERSYRLVGLVFIDLDKFKPINDTYGHAMGDKILQVVAKRIARSVRRIDAACRLGGDEFCVCLEGLGDEDEAVEAAEKIREAIRKPVQVNGDERVLGASIGVSIGSHEDAETMMGQADTAMYQSKSGRRGEVIVFEPEMSTLSREFGDIIE